MLSNSWRISEGCSRKWYGIGGAGGGDGGTGFIDEAGRLTGDASIMTEGKLSLSASSIGSVTFRGMEPLELSGLRCVESGFIVGRSTNLHSHALLQYVGFRVYF